MNSINKLLLSTHLIKRAYQNDSLSSTILTPQQKRQLNIYTSAEAKTSPLPQSSAVPKAVPVNTSKFVLPSYYDPILKAIRKAESNVADYDTMVGSFDRHNLTNMTLEQVMDYQSKHKKGSAAGAYQIIAPTMRELVTRMKLNPKTDIYDKNLQDRMALQLLKQRGFNSYLEGKIPLSSVRVNLAKEWAGLPIAGGKSYHSGKGNNAARISEKEYLNALEQTRKLYMQSQLKNNTYARAR